MIQQELIDAIDKGIPERGVQLQFVKVLRISFYKSVILLAPFELI